MAKLKHIAIATQDPDWRISTSQSSNWIGQGGQQQCRGVLPDRVNIAVLHFKNEVVAGEGFAPGYSGLHHIGRVDNSNAEGYYLTDGNINIAVLHFKNEVVAGEGFAPGYSGLHHIGFQVQDAATTDAVLRKLQRARHGRSQQRAALGDGLRARRP